MNLVATFYSQFIACVKIIEQIDTILFFVNRIGFYSKKGRTNNLLAAFTNFENNHT